MIKHVLVFPSHWRPCAVMTVLGWLTEHGAWVISASANGPFHDVLGLLKTLYDGSVVRRHESVELSDLGCFRAVPRAMDFGQHGVRRGRNDTALDETSERRSRDHVAGVSGSVHHCVNFESCRLGIQRWEHDADAGPDPRYDQRLASSGAHRFDEIFVVPGVHLTFPRHVDSMWRGLMDFRAERSVRAVGLGCRRDDGDFHQRGWLSQHYEVRPQLRETDVFDGLQQAGLVVEQQDHGVGWI